MYSKNKDIAKLVRRRLREGWRFQTGKRHNKLISPFGRKFVVPSTPSDRRAYQNFRQDISRVAP